MVPLIGRIGSAAALAWTLLAAADPQPEAPLSAFDFTDAVYLAHGIDAARIEDRLDRRPGASIPQRAPAVDRRAGRALEMRGGYDSTGCSIYFMARGAIKRDGLRSEPEARPVFLFPRRGSATEFRQDPLFDTIFGLHPLGLWRTTLVRFTRKPFASPSGMAALEEIRARNGTDLDGTPILKHVSEIEQLEKAGDVEVARSEEWKVWPLWADPRRERIPRDAYLDGLIRPEGSAVDQEIEQDFVCLQHFGDYLQRPMPRLPPFVQPLPVPAELAPAASVDVRAGAFTHRFHPDLPPGTLWGYGGTFPGPTLRVRRGEPETLRIVSGLPPAGNGGFGHPWTSCRIDAGSLDFGGFPADYCKPGEVREHRLTLPATGPSTGWYRDGRLGFSAQNTTKGLAGFIVATDRFDSGNENDPDPRASRLPSGPCDLPLMLADRDFDTSLNRALAWDPFERDGMLAAFDTVNGAVQPVLSVARRKYRFRLLDAGPTRTYDLRWSNGRPFILLGDDAGFLEKPRETATLRVGVGQRRDVVVDFTPVLLSTALYLEDGGRRLLKVIVDRDAPDPSRVPSTLSEPPEPVPANVPVRTFVIENPRGAWTINGQPFDVERPHARLKRGAAEIWVVKNRSNDRRHPIEIAPGPFRILSRNGPTLAPEAGRELLPGDEVRMFVKVGDVAGRYVLSCSNLVHEDQGLMIRWDVEP